MSGKERRVPLTAILSCRNAQPTLARCLDHLIWSGADVIVLDDGSTDRSRQIVRDRLGQGVRELIELPYAGAFDLTLQLRRKAEIISKIGQGWILHADADEFVDSPDGTPLAEYLSYWDSSDIVTFPCTERLFLPKAESEQHDPADYPETMQNFIRMAERDPKQRVFRSNVPLPVWHATGGHSVTRRCDEVSPVPLGLRHYFGLSLDLIRARVLGRVFASHDFAKKWHGNRRGNRMTVVAPPEGLLAEQTEMAKVVTSLPVLKAMPTVGGAAEPCDLLLACLNETLLSDVSQKIETGLPGLRVRAVSEWTDRPFSAPVLCLFEHPAACAGDDPVHHGEAWLRFVAAAQQFWLLCSQTCCLRRIEDADLSAPGLTELVRETMLAAPSAFDPTHAIERKGFSGRLKAITGDKAAELGYV